MIDVVFLLIVFFMVAAVLITQNKKEVELPVAPESQIPDNTPGRLTISIAPNGDFFLNRSQLSEERLIELARDGVRNTPNFEVYLRIDESTPHKHVAGAMELLAQNGVFDVVFATVQSG
jgi:biopolymer transport protein ExbD